MGIESLARESVGSILSSLLAILFMSAMCKINLKEHKSIAVVLIALSGVNLLFTYSGKFLYLQPLASFVILLLFLLYSKNKYTVMYSLICLLVMSFSGLALPYIMALIYGVSADLFLKIYGPIRICTVFITNIIAAIIYVAILRILKKKLFSLTEIITMIKMPIAAEISFFLMLSKYIMFDRASTADYSYYSVRAIGLITIYGLVCAAIYTINYKRKKDIQNGVVEFERKRYDDIVRSSMQMKKIRHDIKNLLLPVKMELDDGNYDNAKIKLNNIIENTENIGQAFNTGCRTVDYILNSKLSEVKNRRIILTGNAESLNFVDDFDLSVILGNMLDNALEATENIENPIIEMSFFDNKSMCNIVCKNSVEKSVLSKNPQLNTSKRDNKIHGFGVMSIKQISRKYKGNVAFYEENAMFGVHVMLPKQ